MPCVSPPVALQTDLQHLSYLAVDAVVEHVVDAAVALAVDTGVVVAVGTAVALAVGTFVVAPVVDTVVVALGNAPAVVVRIEPLGHKAYLSTGAHLDQHLYLEVL